MTEASDYLSEMLRDAQQPGDCVPPGKLLDALKPETNALVAISDPARAETYFAALNDEFGYFPMARQGDTTLSPDQRARWVGLFRWLLTELASWNLAADPHALTLGAAFIAAQSVRGGRGIWLALPPASLASNQPLLNCLTQLIRSTSMSFGVRGGGVEPIWEREAVEAFKVADQAGDWAVIGDSMRLFEQVLVGGGVALSESVRLLSQAGLEHLVTATAAIGETLVAMQVVRALSRPARVALAAASDNPYVQFACVYQAVARHSGNRPLSPSEQNDLSATLLKVAVVREQWIGWMKVFGTYPVRYSALQPALGMALVTAPEGALRTYIDVISLHPLQNKDQYGDGRRAVADCLRTFRNAAPPDRRHMLWRMAYERWSAWDFGKQDVNQHLFAIHWSDLDYAVVGFISECLSASERMQEIQKIQSELQDLDLQWFSSISDVHTAWYRLSSRMQPHAHVAEANPGEDWLCQTTTYWGFDHAANAYAVAKFEARFGSR